MYIYSLFLSLPYPYPSDFPLTEFIDDTSASLSVYYWVLLIFFLTFKVSFKIVWSSASGPIKYNNSYKISKSGVSPIPWHKPHILWYVVSIILALSTSCIVQFSLQFEPPFIKYYRLSFVIDHGLYANYSFNIAILLILGKTFSSPKINHSRGPDANKNYSYNMYNKYSFL